MMFLPAAGISVQIIRYLNNFLEEKMLCSTVFHSVVILWNLNIKDSLQMKTKPH